MPKDNCECNMKEKRHKTTKKKIQKARLQGGETSQRNWFKGVEQRPKGLVNEPAFKNLFRLFSDTVHPPPLYVEPVPIKPEKLFTNEELVEALEEAEYELPFENEMESRKLKAAAKSIKMGVSANPEKYTESVLKITSPSKAKQFEKKKSEREQAKKPFAVLKKEASEKRQFPVPTSGRKTPTNLESKIPKHSAKSEPRASSSRDRD